MPDVSSRAAAVVSALALAALVTSCGDDPDPDAVAEVTPAAAYTAIVTWQAGQQEPVVGDDGEAQLPVVYVAAVDGAGIDVGVQAEVAASTAEVAVVRFADDRSEAFDTELPDQPVIDGGSMLMFDELPPPAPTITVDVVRQLAADEAEPLEFELRARPVGQPDDDAVTAVVTSVTQP
jgi:hypothetical protein